MQRNFLLTWSNRIINDTIAPNGQGPLAKTTTVRPHPAMKLNVMSSRMKPHSGCAKFISRFGVDAQRFANGDEGRPRRLCGLNAVVVRAGQVRPGDGVRVERPPT